MALILLRHTRPEGASGVCYGRTDLPLAEGFAQETAAIAAGLPAVARIVSSPLSRCLRLAQAIGTARDLPVQVLPDLIEMDFGRWENHPWDRIPRAEIDAWSEDFLDARPHGGESVRQLAARARRALDMAATGPRPALVVTHAGIIKAARVATGEGDGWRAETAFGTWVTVDWP